MTANTDINISQNPDQKPVLTENLAEFRGVAVKLKNFHQLSPGDIFKANVLDIRSNSVTIRLSSGGDITAKSLILPDARIGDDAFFLVKENNKGQIALEMLRPQNAAIIANIAKEALVTAGIYPTNENMSLVKTLIENNLPIDTASIQKAVFFHYSAASLPINQIVFLMKENFAMETANIDTLGKLIGGGLGGHLADTFAQISRLPESLQARIAEILKPLVDTAGGKEAAREEKTLAARIAASLPVAVNNKHSLSVMPDYFKALYTALKETEGALSKSDAPAADIMREAVSDLARRIEFMDQIDNCKYYAQIPVNINQVRGTAELYVFKQPNKRPDLRERASVLIALDNETIGRVETLIELKSKRLDLQFRAEMPQTLKLITAAFDGLKDALADSGYYIGIVRYKNITERFTVTDDIPVSDEAPPPRRYAFDMRV